MSHYLCVSIVPIRERSAALEDVVAKALEFGIQVADAGLSPTGRFTRGKRSDRLVVFLMVGGYSSYLLDRGPRRFRYSSRCIAFFTWALEQYGGISVLVHIARGLLQTDPISPAGTRRVTFEQLIELFPRLEPEVRHVCIAAERIPAPWRR